jgi:hypothetical protein
MHGFENQHLFFQRRAQVVSLRLGGSRQHDQARLGRANRKHVLEIVEMRTRVDHDNIVSERRVRIGNNVQSKR